MENLKFNPVSTQRLELSQFSEQQRYYLNMLSKFSGRNNKTDVVSASMNSTQKVILVTEYFSYLSINEQVQWNDNKASFQLSQKYSLYITTATFGSSFVYYLVTTPVTKSIAIQGVKSAAFGFFTGFFYYKIKQAQFKKNLHHFYVLTLDRINDKRRQVLKN